MYKKVVKFSFTYTTKNILGFSIQFYVFGFSVDPMDRSFINEICNVFRNLAENLWCDLV